MLYDPGNACEICGKEQESLLSCKICNANVCESCIVVSDDICITCREARCQICEEFLSSRACNTCGKLVCEDHGVKINESTECDRCRMSD